MKHTGVSIFEDIPISKAVFKSTIPSIVSMLMALVYNLADTFFIGQTHDPLMVAAVSIATPVFLLLMAIGLLFGIGGTSVISRALGAGRKDYVKHVSSFCFWAGAGVGVVVMAAMLLFMDNILALIGTSPDTIEYTRSYLTIVTSGAVLVIFATCFSNIIRAEGKAKEAMFGMLLGNILNVILDPIFILWLDMGVAGAAWATLIGNAVGALYYVLYLLRGKSILSINIKHFKAGDKILAGVLSIGLPAALGNMLMSFSNILVNNLMSGYDDLAIAGMGVSIKVILVTVLIVIGLGQGVQPLLGYNCGAKNWERFGGIFKFSIIYATVVSVVLTLVSYFCSGAIVSAFLQDQKAFGFGLSFARITIISGPSLGILFVCINGLQAMGAALPSMILSVSRQGLFFIPILLIFNAIGGMYGIVWAQPVTDYLSASLALLLFLITRNRLRKLSATSDKPNSSENGPLEADAQQP